MSREQERIKKKLENNPIVECNKIQKKFCPELFSMFGKISDPRHQSYLIKSLECGVRFIMADILPWKQSGIWMPSRKQMFLKV